MCIIVWFQDLITNCWTFSKVENLSNIYKPYNSIYLKDQIFIIFNINKLFRKQILMYTISNIINKKKVVQTEKKQDQ